MAKELAPRLDPNAIEKPLYARWVDEGAFSVDPDTVLKGEKDPFVIVIPPPNVTAVLHMGHGLNNTVQDVLIRWRRMQGRASLWAPGTDHAGIATQNVVERLLAEEGKTRDDLGREAFVERVWEFVEETGGAILDQLKAIGCSCDWERTRFTLDPGLSKAVREVFVRLYEKGLIYRGEYIINWCPRCLTALSNEEAEGEEVQGRLYHLRYLLPPELEEAARSAWETMDAARSARESGDVARTPEPQEEAAARTSGPGQEKGHGQEEGHGEEEDHGEEAGQNDRLGVEPLGQLPDGRWYLTVSTTRPETMLGDTAVAVHPDDDRFKALVGAEVELPLTGRRIPIIADEYVDREFGTGMVKVTPAHDPNDFEMAQRSGISLLDVMTPQAAMGPNAPEAFQGMDRFAARKAVVKALEEQDLFGGEDSHTHTIPRCYRCDTVVEPRLSEQWFVRMKPLAEPALQASRDGTVTFVPGRWQKVYEHWMENIRDWCISRQLWWGHRIPVWYCQDCQETIVAREDPESCPSCRGSDLEQDPDVLDTWFSSWLWPFSIFGWPQETQDLKAFYPGHVLSTAPEILFFWVARMIMAGYEFLGEAPFNTVYLHATVRDTQGRKMSKSLGNGIDPLEVVDQFGADALRFTVISAAAVGTDIHLDPDDLEASFAPGRNFANKVWNAGRFTLMTVGEDPIRSLDEVQDSLELTDRWILSRLSHTSGALTRELEKFRLHDVAEKAYHFFWGELADWYLELVKPRLRPEAEEGSRQAARTTLVTVFDGILRLLHPLIPFVTEELWQQLPWPEGGKKPRSLITAPWPEPVPAWADAEAESRVEAVQELITQIRSLRKEYGVPEGVDVDVVLRAAPESMQEALGAQDSSVRRLARVNTLSILGVEAAEAGGSERGTPGSSSGTPGRADAQGTAGAHAVLSNGTEVFLPLQGVIDLEKERDRLAGEVRRLEGQLVGVRKKLDNRNFLEKAPEEVVARERDKEASFQEQMVKLQEKIAVLESS